MTVFLREKLSENKQEANWLMMEHLTRRDRNGDRNKVNLVLWSSIEHTQEEEKKDFIL